MTVHHGYGSIQTEGGFQRPSFWTKRKKSATGLIATVALIAGIAIAFKLFDQTVPNNTVRDASSFNFDITKQDTLYGDATFIPATAVNPIFRTDPGGPDMYPGDTRTVSVRVKNTNAAPAKDATFYVYVNNITVQDRSTGTPVTIASTDPRWSRFVTFFNLKVDKEKVLTSALGDVTVESGSYATACTGGLREITKNSACDLGTVRKPGSKDIAGNATDIRNYRFAVSEADDGTDQSAFKGWQITFELTFQARLPAVAENTAPVSER